MTAHQFSMIVRKRLNLPKEQSLWLFVGGKYNAKGDTLISEIYEKRKDPDGFLYFEYATENVYGQ